MSAKLVGGGPVVLDASKDLVPLYQWGKVLGVGSYAQVVAGCRITDRVEVALKVPKSVAKSGAFLAEAQMMNLFHHHHIVRLLDYGTYAGLVPPCLVVERCIGDMAQNPEAFTTLASIKKFGRELFEALAYMHARGWVHRDIKQDNILLGAGYAVKLADFGLACRVNTVTNQERHGGSLYFTPPEYLLDPTLPAHQRYDCWAAGLLVAETAAGYRLCPLYPAERKIADTVACSVAQMDSIQRLIGGVQGAGYGLRFSANGRMNRLRQVPPQPQHDLMTKLLKGGHPGAAQSNVPIPHIGIDFFQRILNYNMMTRLTAQQARSHPFLGY